MFLRLLFVLLIALNIAVGAWLLLGQDDVHGRAATDAGVPELHLLSERPPAPSSAPTAGIASQRPGRRYAVEPGLQRSTRSTGART